MGEIKDFLLGLIGIDELLQRLSSKEVSSSEELRGERRRAFLEILEERGRIPAGTVFGGEYVIAYRSGDSLAFRRNFFSTEVSPGNSLRLSGFIGFEEVVFEGDILDDLFRGNLRVFANQWRNPVTGDFLEWVRGLFPSDVSRRFQEIDPLAPEIIERLAGMRASRKLLNDEGIE